MPILELSILAATVACAVVGGCCIYWAKADADSRRARWGRGLFVLTLLALGSTALVAVMTRSTGLPPLGLVSGLLVVGMLWEGSPQPAAPYYDETA